MSNADSRIPVTAMTLAEQCALALRVPASGTEWLDDMIEKRIRLDFELAQYSGLAVDPIPEEHKCLDMDAFIDEALGRTDINE